MNVGMDHLSQTTDKHLQLDEGWQYDWPTMWFRPAYGVTTNPR
jgi:hypothetical protein